MSTQTATSGPDNREGTRRGRVPSPDGRRPNASAASRWIESLFRPVDIASLVFFRIAFAALMLIEVLRNVGNGWIDAFYIQPSFHFTYYGFGWVRPWPGAGMSIHFVVLGLALVCMAAGAWYRIASVVSAIGFTYLFLLDQSTYLNHIYLLCIISFLMIVIPAHRAWSVDARRRPAIRSGTASAWALWVLRAQVGLVYFYAGVAKINPDWLSGYPLRLWLPQNLDYPLIGSFFGEAWMALAMSWMGLLFDLFIVPALLWRRTRRYAVPVALVFNVMNTQLFEIGIFPYFMIAATLMYLEPDWPRRLLRKRSSTIPAKTRKPKGKKKSQEAVAAPPPVSKPLAERLAVAVLGVHMLVQLVLPLRHYLYPGDAAWTDEGHRFAWRMRLHAKTARYNFEARDSQTGEAWSIDPLHYLTSYQLDKMLVHPDMVLQFAHRVAEVERAERGRDIAVHAAVAVSVNGRPFQPLIDDSVDLARQPRSLAPASWILPFELRASDLASNR